LCQLCCLFFSCDAAHRDLHSFPTRRSSDLLRGGEVLHLADHRRLAAFARAENVDGLLREVLRALSACQDQCAAAIGDEAAHEKRSEEHTLNSSHVKISYAVFCLKKKKKAED